MKTLSTLLSLIGMFLVLNVSAQNQNPTVTIYDIQYTADPYGVSPYEEQTVTVTGIVTSSAQDYDLGYIYIQDEGGGPWSGIMLTGSSDINNLYRGEEVTVVGQVVENFGLTILYVSSATLTGQLKEIAVSDLDPSDSTAYISNGWEKWESVLVQYKDPEGNKLYISHPKLNVNSDFGEYAVSMLPERASKKLGVVLAGRSDASNQSSLYVSIVTDSAWADNSGTMQVPLIVTSTAIEMDGLIGVMNYAFSTYKLLPRNNDDFVNVNLELEPTNLPGSPLNINESKKETFALFPNPASDQINIALDLNDEAKVHIYDLSGRHIKQETLFKKSKQINIADLAPGIYIMELKANNKLYQPVRFVVK